MNTKARIETFRRWTDGWSVWRRYPEHRERALHCLLQVQAYETFPLVPLAQLRSLLTQLLSLPLLRLLMFPTDIATTIPLRSDQSQSAFFMSSGSDIKGALHRSDICPRLHHPSASESSSVEIVRGTIGGVMVWGLDTRRVDSNVYKLNECYSSFLFSVHSYYCLLFFRCI